MMTPMSQPSLTEVDWSKIPAPQDDGAARHLAGMRVPAIRLASTDGDDVVLSSFPGRVVIFAYPRTGEPGKIGLTDDWDMIPGARGCTPQACSFRDLHADLTNAGADNVFGLSTQDSAYQREMAQRLHLPFPVLSDSALTLSTAMNLPRMEVSGQILLKRMALVLHDGVVESVFYPVFPPDRNAGDVLEWLKAR